jgi:hypothetical protein
MGVATCHHVERVIFSRIIVDPVQVFTELNSPQEEGEDDTGLRDPIDALNDDDREYDISQEDTPSVDQGY